MRRSMARVAKLAFLAAMLSVGVAAMPVQAQSRLGVFDIHCIAHAYGSALVAISYSNGHTQFASNTCNTPDGHGLYPWPNVSEPLADVVSISISMTVLDTANQLRNNSCTATSTNGFNNPNCLADESGIPQITVLVSIPKVQ